MLVKSDAAAAWSGTVNVASVPLIAAGAVPLNVKPPVALISWLAAGRRTGRRRRGACAIGVVTVTSTVGRSGRRVAVIWLALTS